MTGSERAPHVKALARLGARPDAVAWTAGFKSWQVCWGSCDRPEWMLWVLGALSGEPGSRARAALSACVEDCVAAAERLGLPTTRAAECAEYFASSRAPAVVASHVTCAATSAAADPGPAMEVLARVVRRHYPRAPELPGTDGDL